MTSKLPTGWVTSLKTASEWVVALYKFITWRKYWFTDTLTVQKTLCANYTVCNLLIPFRCVQIALCADYQLPTMRSFASTRILLIKRMPIFQTEIEFSGHKVTSQDQIRKLPLFEKHHDQKTLARSDHFYTNAVIYYSKFSPDANVFTALLLELL